MRKLFLVAFIMAALTAVGNAQANPIRGGVCTTLNFKGHDTKFNCSSVGLGNVTIQEIYEKGWRVVLLNQPNEGGTWMGLVIEEQRK